MHMYNSHMRTSKVGVDQDCATCNKKYTVDKSRSKHCNQCRHTHRKLACARCGNPRHYRAKLCLTCAALGKEMENHAAWKGGTIVSMGNGYRYLRVRGDHPRVKNRKSKWNYVQEHILVMEAHLGRCLLSHENVHHKNGQKLDNRIENLELWSRVQPAGQRVRDKVAWATEIIALYGDDLNKL